MLLALLPVLSAIVVAGMVRVGAIDHPVERSSHSVPTPKGGGVGIVACVLAGIAISHPGGRADIILGAAALLLAVASYLDDVLHWPFWLKLGAQVTAAIIIVAAGMAAPALALPGAGYLGLGMAAPAFAVCWLLFTTNATNFMDGLNGLAAGSVAVGCLVLVYAAGAQTAWPEALIVAGVAGFLPFNFPAARIFMGDVGSQFLGFLAASLALRHAGEPRLSMILPLSLSPMLFDVAFTLLRRWRRGDRLTHPHRGHLYQLAQRTGVPAWRVTLLYWGMGAWAGYCGVQWPVRGMPGWLVAAILPFIAWGGVVMWWAHRARLKVW